MKLSKWVGGKRQLGLLLACSFLWASWAGPVTAQPTVSFKMPSDTASTSPWAVTVVLSAPSADTITVQVDTQNGTAVAPGDYTPISSGTLIFPAGSTSQSFTVSVNNAGASGKSFSIVLSNPISATLGLSPMTMNISNSPPPPPPPSNPLTVTLKVTSPPHNPIVVAPGAPTAVSITATATPYNPPTGTFSWSWSYVIEYAATAGNFGPPPPDAGYTFNVDPPGTTAPNVSVLSATATFYKAGYWRVRNISAPVVFTDSNGKTQTASGITPDINFTVVVVTLSPAPMYVASQWGGIMVATVTPNEAASQVAFVSSDPSVADVIGGAPYLTVATTTSGTVQIKALVGSSVAASADVIVMDISYSPQSGPVFTQVSFSISSGPAFFSANTKVSIDGLFYSDDFPAEAFSVSHDASKIKYSAGTPNQITLAVADVFPSSFLSSSNPALKMSLTGAIGAIVTLTDGDKSFAFQASFEISQSGYIGQLVNGVFQEPQGTIYVWQANSAGDLIGVDPVIYLYGQIARPMNDFTGPPPSTITAQLRSFRDDGTPVSAGVTLQFALVSSDSSNYTYQTQKPLLLIENPMYEGEGPEVIAIISDDSCYTRIVWPPR